MSSIASTDASSPLGVQSSAPAPPVGNALTAHIARVNAAEAHLVDDAMKRLGLPAPPTVAEDAAHTTNLMQQAQVHANTQFERTPRAVELGTLVRLGPSDADAWNIVGVGPSDRIRLGQRTEEGARFTTRRWSAVVGRNPDLATDIMLGPSGALLRIVETGDVARLGRRASVVTTSLVDPTHAPGSTTWGEVLAASGADRTRPVLHRPSNLANVMGLRDLLHDDHIVVDELPRMNGVLVGTSSMPGLGGRQLAWADATADWFRTHAGLETWKDAPLLMSVNDTTAIGNGYATYMRGLAQVGTGPTDFALRGALTAQMPGTFAELEAFRSQVGETVHQLPLMLTHEAGHITQSIHWGDDVHRHDLTRGVTARIEEGVVREAYADLFAAARFGKVDLGVRKLDELPNTARSLDRFRAWNISHLQLADAHIGTQLVTKPMVALAEAHGWNFVAEVTGAATRAIGVEITRGSISSVTIPDAARALHTAVAGRLGAHAPAAQALKGAWQALKVLR